ncbi:EAL domain-containing protein [Sphingomonas sp. S-NIH.Pt15_0812]|uniref:putative bifunctional diguanylate cyclase/phosphodiesterase n=1 Tax=Sphingomonas sp. S-NIH.Pt15_0812 TaxID=1920129 RepID=UPI0013E00787|nr:EAL domain-containing protein [Sphingomonas sp. S-NIH.Pt15_0812]
MTDRRDIAAELETARLTSLLNMKILDTQPQQEFDEITRLAALACDAASAAVTLIDANRGWFKSRVRVPVPEVPREHALCSLEIDKPTLLVIPDTHLDSRCIGNPLTQGDGAIRFYAGAPLITSTGHCLGRLCVMGHEPRLGLTDGQRTALTELARIVTDRIEARQNRQLGLIASQVVDVTSDAILCADSIGRITFWNAAAETMFGRSAANAIGSELSIIVPPRFRAAHRAGFAAAAQGGHMKLAGQMVALTATKADGSEFPIELSLSRWQTETGSLAFAAIIRDVSARKLLEHEREQARAFLNTVIEHLPAMLFVKDVDTQRYLLMNKAGAEIAELPQADFIGRTDSELFPGRGEGYEARDRAACETPGVHIFESEHVRADGQQVHLRTKRLRVDSLHGQPRYLLGLTEDVTEMRQAQAEVTRLATYDSLTGLRNRASYIERLGMLVETRSPFALLSIDLDRFKAINDQFGHVVGDDVLARVALRLSGSASSGDLLARVGGDEFVMVLVGDDAHLRCRRLAQAIVAALEAPIETDRARAHVGASVGVALFPKDGETAEAVRQASDLALYRAKDQGRGTACFYSEEMDAAMRDHQMLEIALREAIETDAITLAFQPVRSLGSGQITSFEALARWTHDVRGSIPPSEFIGLAEECGLIEKLGAGLLRKACIEATRWPDHIRVAVNLSPLQFQNDRLCETVRQVLEDTGLAPERLQLEVTEGLLIRDVDRTFKQLQQLRSLGIQILMDDFGVGYSSLSYFERFPFDKVKIDRTFVDIAPTSTASQAIIKAVAQLGTALGMGVVAEGVETKEQLQLLTAFGCSHVQGYLTGKPMTPSDAYNALVTDPPTADCQDFAI